MTTTASGDAEYAPVWTGPFGWRTLAGPLALAFGTRLLMLALIAYSTTTGDMTWYDDVANNILHHGAYSDSTTAPFEPTLYRPPLYPAFIALIRFVAGPSFLALQLVQSLLGCVAVALLGSAVGTVSRRHGRWALWALAACPYDAVYSGAMLSEALVGFLLIGGLTLPLLVRGAWRWTAAGVLLGLASLTRDVYMLFIPLFGVVSASIALRKQRRIVQCIAAFAVILGGIMAIAPWTARNYAVAHRLIPISRSSFAHSVYAGTWVRDISHIVDGHFGKPEELPAFAWKLPGERELYAKWSWFSDADPAERDRVYMQMFKRRVMADPIGTAAAWVRRSPYIWVGTSRFDLFDFRPKVLARGTPLYFVLKTSLFGLNVVSVLAGMAGILLAIRKRNWRLLWFTAPILYTLAVLTPLGVIEPRYTQPIYACLLVMGCHAARYAWVAWRRLRRRRPLAEAASISLR